MKESKNQYVIFFDGSITKNPNGDMGMGVVVFRAKNCRFEFKNTRKIKSSYNSIEKIHSETQKINFGEDGFQETTNNVAEHLAMNLALGWAVENITEPSKVFLFGDSQLAIKQAKREWGIGGGPYHDPAIYNLKLLSQLRSKEIFVEPIWVPRDFNVADKYSR